MSSRPIRAGSSQFVQFSLHPVLSLAKFLFYFEGAPPCMSFLFDFLLFLVRLNHPHLFLVGSDAFLCIHLHLMLRPWFVTPCADCQFTPLVSGFWLSCFSCSFSSIKALRCWSVPTPGLLHFGPAPLKSDKDWQKVNYNEPEAQNLFAAAPVNVPRDDFLSNRF